jgi:KaiC/GvpD/RAD55 family RecA-like ATPase
MTSVAKDYLRRDRRALEQALRDAGAVVHGPQCRCPFHDDSTPSASMYRNDKGVWRFRCHASVCGFRGDVFDVVARATGKPISEVLIEMTTNASAKPSSPDRTNLRIYPSIDALRAVAKGLAAAHVYTNPDGGAVELIVLRLIENGVKRFLQASPQGSGFVMMAPPKPWPIYERARVRDAQTVVVVEGEKCADVLNAILPDGYAATTSPAGAGNGKHADWSPLAGKQVVLWPDHDDPGRKHMHDVAVILNALDPPADVRLIDPDGLGLAEAGDDVVDYLECHGGETAESKWAAVEAALATAAPAGPSAGLHRRIEDIIAGRYAAVGLPWPILDKLTLALLPGTVTLLCGGPGSGKSFFLLQAALDWLARGVKFALYELEQEQEFWQTRVLAMLAGDARHTDPAWVKANPDAARAAFEEHLAVLNDVSRRLTVAGKRQLTHAELLDWIRTQAKAGCRVIAVDPVTAVRATKEPWAADQEFVMAATAIAAEYGSSLVLVTHPRIRPRSEDPLDELAGGAAYARFAQAVLWLKPHPGGKALTWRTGDGSSAGWVNCTVRIAKARNGRGGGLDVALQFDGAALRFDELGLVVGDGADPELLE